MYNNMSGPKNISDEERADLKEALTIYYSVGGPITEAFVQVESGLIDRYYRRKKKYPEEIEEIHAEAQAAAQKLVSSRRLDVDAELERKSRDIQRQAVKALMAGLPNLELIAMGGPLEIVNKGTGEVTTVPVYPRNQAQATRVLLNLARDGIVPRKRGPRTSAGGGMEKQDGAVLSLPVLGVPPDFSKLEYTKPDGRRISAAVERDGDVLEPDDEE